MQQAAQGKPIVQHLHFSSLTTIAGSSNSYVEVSTGSSLPGKTLSSGSYAPEVLRNLVFLDGSYGHARWLFENNDNVLQKVDKLYESGDVTKSVVAIYLEVTRGDSNKDGSVDEDDAQIPAMTHVDGSGFTELSAPVDRILQQSVSADGKRVGLLEQDGNKLLYREYAVDTFAKVAEQTVTEIKQTQ
ncbi:MAG: hypothetical protein ABIQ97_05305 [Lysobacteraceae bacterium]